MGISTYEIVANTHCFAGRPRSDMICLCHMGVEIFGARWAARLYGRFKRPAQQPGARKARLYGSSYFLNRVYVINYR